MVAKPDDKWGETPCAFVELKPGATATAEELIAWCRKHLAAYKCPRYIVFETVPKTSTGKMQKFKLRETAKADVKNAARSTGRRDSSGRPIENKTPRRPRLRGDGQTKSTAWLCRLVDEFVVP